MDSPSTSSVEVDEAPRLHHRASRFRPILFRRATSATFSQTATSGTGDPDEDADSSTSAAGQEARDFYEKLVAESTQVVDNKDTLPQKSLKRKNDRKRRKRKHEKTHQNVNDMTDKQKAKLASNLLHGAQYGDLKKIKEALKQGCNINSVDDFMWTPLMCACHSGQTGVVKYLLKRGALWVDYCDQRGRTALDLAKAARNMDIYDLLISYSHGNTAIATQTRTRQKEAYEFSCKVCKMDFKETSKDEHESSTVHLFNCQHKPQSTLYHIPEGNIGFKLLLKEGWDKEQGLGPEGKGSKFPVKTILKRDRQGLGANPDDPQSRPRVTHFQPHDVAAVKKPKKDKAEKKMRANTLSRKKRQKQDVKERAWEIGFRQSFNTCE